MHIRDFASRDKNSLREPSGPFLDCLVGVHARLGDVIGSVLWREPRHSEGDRHRPIQRVDRQSSTMFIR